jgi:ubiquinol-cytochrome c reductase iron-sulfur subunit
MGLEAIATRRDAVLALALGFAGVGGLAAVWPLIDQMNPNSSSLRESVVVDLGTFDVARLKLVQRRSGPILIRWRTPAEIAIAQGVSVASLIDPLARAAGLGDKETATDDNRTKAGHRQWLLVAAACTRCGCLLKDGRVSGFDPEDAFFCACCASRYDLAGRVRAGPAPVNLAVPSYRFIASAKLEISL